MAARVARMIGEDPAPFETKADLIRRGMQRELWLPQQGWFGEFKDYPGQQAGHPSPAVW